ncbi:pantoate--beta-alanine ligase [Virgibacillus soli]
MKVIRSISELQQLTKTTQKKIGFVPTMGFLHKGHMTLMERAKQENELVIVSIFVNPLQFGPTEDYETYPRNEVKDVELAKEIGVDIVFIPQVQDMYPNKMKIKLSINERIDQLCGKSRPGHFDGVLTVLAKLFHIVNPTKVYFGLKDAQQVAVVDALIQDLNFPIELVGVPTVREESGLAISSRNVHLSPQEKKEATELYKALNYGRKLVVDGETNPVMIEKEVKNYLKNNTSSKIDYIDILSYPDLKKVDQINQRVILAGALYFEKARIIDNLIFNEQGNLENKFS